MIGFYNYTVILTYVGMLAGFTGITFAMNGSTRYALLCLMIAGVCDMFDGKIASTMERTKQEKRFGIQIDSLSDLICFGVLPASIVYRVAGSAIGLYIAALYVLCALIRLAWFNVDEEERQDQEDGCRENYMGLPVTTSALIFPLLFCICKLLHWSVFLPGQLVMLATAIAFLTPFRLKKPARMGKAGLLVCGIAVLVILLVGVKL